MYWTKHIKSKHMVEILMFLASISKEPVFFKKLNSGQFKLCKLSEWNIKNTGDFMKYLTTALEEMLKAPLLDNSNQKKLPLSEVGFNRK